VSIEDPRKPVIDRYAEGGPLLIQAASNLSPELATARPIPGTWSIAEVVAHLLDADLVLAERMKRLIAEDSPRLEAFDENAWIARLDSNAMPVDEAAALFAANRKWMARILRAQGESAFARSGIHSEAGRVTLAEVLVKAANHLDHHLKFLYAKRAKLGVAIYPRYTANTGV
jgi:uncharacterized damage-inducible protein DinB